MTKIRGLLVDGEEELASTLAERLSLRGIASYRAMGSEDTLKKLDTHKHDVAVLDVKIPEISGIALKKKMEEKSPGMKFVFLTGHGSEADFRAGSAEAGLEYYVLKRFNIEDLIEKMKEVLGAEGGMT